MRCSGCSTPSARRTPSSSRSGLGDHRPPGDRASDRRPRRLPGVGATVNGATTGADGSADARVRRRGRLQAQGRARRLGPLERAHLCVDPPGADPCTSSDKAAPSVELEPARPAASPASTVARAPCSISWQASDADRARAWPTTRSTSARCTTASRARQPTTGSRSRSTPTSPASTSAATRATPTSSASPRSTARANGRRS